MSYKNFRRQHLHRRLLFVLISILFCFQGTSASADTAATHIYHNHMPNFWPYYDVSQYDSLPVGSPLRYMYDGQVKELKESPPANYTYYLPNSGAPMPHDDLASYYAHHAKLGAYLSWPMDTASANRSSYPLSQTHVTMSAAVVNNVQSFAELGNQDGYNLGWGDYWASIYDSVLTQNGSRALDLIHFSGHHTMGPLVGNDYFLKDLIYQNITLSRSYFLGDSFESSKGFFPTELGFSERIIPVLTKLGIEWSVLGNVHYSRTLKDYPYLNSPGVDTLVSPPNRADLQNESTTGEWVSIQMYNEAQVTQNKFPFASIPHWVQFVDPDTAEVHKVAGIPVEQASSWEEGYLCSVDAGAVTGYEADATALGRTQYFVIAHDGDNSSGCAGDGGTWLNSGRVTYASNGVTAMGVDEYLAAHPIPEDDVVHVQDGSWIDTRDSSADPTWYHWHLPMGVWSGQLSAFNTAHGTDYEALYANNGQLRQHLPSLELGYHYLERNFALLQAAQNYAATAEQIWLDDHPNHWSPSTALDHSVTYDGNQLNPWMMSYPVKGDASNDYAGGANPAELAWYFLLASIDSGFGYYDENQDDSVKPTLSFNQSLYFSEPYVAANLAKDATGPSVWWPQRYPYNPGSVNNSKAEGWATMYMDSTWAIYTYAYDVSGIADIQVKIRVHASATASPTDKTYQLYDPAAHASDPNVDPSAVGAWTSYPMLERDLGNDINGVSWQADSTAVFQVVPAQKIGNLFYVYLDGYQEQLLDYYIEATDSLGNVTKSEIQQVYVGAGRYSLNDAGVQVEDPNGAIAGEHPFFTDTAIRRTVNVYAQASTPVETLTLETREDGASSWSTHQVAALSGSAEYHRYAATYAADTAGLWVRYLDGSSYVPSDQGVLLTEGTYTLYADGTVDASTPVDLNVSATIYYYSADWSEVCLHYRVDAGTWTTAPGLTMTPLGSQWWTYTVDMGVGSAVEFDTNNCNGSWDNNGGSNYSVNAGVWSLEDGVVTSGAPENADNIPPTAVISPGSQTVPAGTTLTLSGAGSSDPDGSIVSYQWSTGETSTEITVTVSATQTVTLTVTDDAGASASTAITLSVPAGSTPDANFDALYFRGTPNGWAATPMELTADHTWSLTVTFTGEDAQRFKFDLYADWTTNYGDNNSDGVLDQGGADIYASVTGDYLVTVNDETLAYTMTRLSDGFSSNLSTLYFRGTPNAWEASAMELVADNTWQLTVEFDGSTSQRFKFDVHADWTYNFGDDNSDGVLDQSGSDIYTDIVGTYVVQVNDGSMSYSIMSP